MEMARLTKALRGSFLAWCLREFPQDPAMHFVQKNRRKEKKLKAASYDELV